MKIRIVLLLAITAGAAYAVMGPHTATRAPVDLRDAVADRTAIGALSNSTEAPDITVTEPAVAPVQVAQDAAAGDSEQTPLELKFKRFAISKKLVDSAGQHADGRGDKSNLNVLFIERDAALREERARRGAEAVAKMARMFDKGRKATREDLRGWHSGRAVDGKNGAESGALLIGADGDRRGWRSAAEILAKTSAGDGAFTTFLVIDGGGGNFDTPEAAVEAAEKFYGYPTSMPEAKTSYPTVMAQYRVYDGVIIEKDSWISYDAVAYSYYAVDVTPQAAP